MHEFHEFLEWDANELICKKSKSGGGRDGGKIHKIARMAKLQRCEDASKNDQGWLVSDWR